MSKLEEFLEHAQTAEAAKLFALILAGLAMAQEFVSGEENPEEPFYYLAFLLLWAIVGAKNSIIEAIKENK